MLTDEAFYILRHFYKKRKSTIVDEAIKKKLQNNSKYSTVLRQLPHWLDVMAKGDYLKYVSTEKINGRYAGFYQITEKGIAEYKIYVADRRRMWLNNLDIFKTSNVISFLALIVAGIALYFQFADFRGNGDRIRILE